MNFKIVNDRLTALAEMTRADFDAIVANTGKTPLVFAKGGKVNAAIRFATEDGIFTTFNNTGIENTKAYKTGDAFVTRLDNNENVARVFEDNPNTYVVDGDKVASLFDIAEGEVVENGENFGRKYAGKNIVEAIPFTGGMDIVCSWGPQVINDQTGYLFYSRVTDSVYGCDEGGMEAYELYLG